MKKIILSVFAVIALSFFSQAQFRIGVKGGLSESSQRINVSSGNVLFSNDDFKSFHAGLISEFQITENVYLQPQILYTRRGGTLQHSTGGTDTKVRTNYIDVPVNVVYKIPLSFGKVFGGAGAAFSYGFGGRLKEGAGKTSMYGSNKPWKHEDVSLSFTAGFEFNNGLFVSANSQRGLMDVYKTEGVSVKNRSVSVSVGYMIDWKQLKRKS
jgi:hypothetical protein